MCQNFRIVESSQKFNEMTILALSVDVEVAGWDLLAYGVTVPCEGGIEPEIFTPPPVTFARARDAYDSSLVWIGQVFHGLYYCPAGTGDD